MKERFRLAERLGISMLILATSIGCGDKSEEGWHPTIEPTPIVTPIPLGARLFTVTPEALSIELWRSLSPLEKIKRLELKQYPIIEGFNATNELKLVTADFYCQQTQCEISPEEMANNIFFVSPSRFLEEAEKHVGRKYTEEEIEDILRFQPEMVNSNNQSFINIDLHNRLSQRTRQSNPDAVIRLGQRDFATDIDKSLFIHIFSHMNQIDEVYYFEPFSLRLSLTAGAINVPKVGRLEGFTFVGEKEDKRPFYINGAKEAITELTAIIIGKKTGFYMSLSDKYNGGAMLIDMLNKRSGVTNQEFLEYANGTRPVSELLRKWGSLRNPHNPNEKAAIMALAMIGLYVDGAVKSFDEAKRGVEEWLSPSP